MSSKATYSVVCFDRSTYHSRRRRPEPASLRKRIRGLSEARVRYGYRRIHVLLRREDRVVAMAANDCWPMDFLSDQLSDGREIRVLATPERVAATYGRPKCIRGGQRTGVHLEGPRPVGVAAWRV